MPNQRINSAAIVQRIFENKVFFAELKSQVPEQDLAFVNMLVLTSLRHWQGLNAVLKIFLHKKIPHKHRFAQYLMLLAIAELLFMETPPYAVIDETVKNIKYSTDKFLGGLANAVLRKVIGQKDSLLSTIRNTSPLPPDFVKILNGYDKQDTSLISSVVCSVPPLDITAKDNPQDWQNKLNADLLPNGTLRLAEAKQIHLLPEYTQGRWWVQDVAASLPVLAMGNVNGLEVIDLCAAPGGKTAQLAARGAKVTALDISAKRLEKLKQNMQRLGFNNITTYAVDALQYLEQAPQQFDAVLLDAPCSATGTFRRHPEVLHIKNQQDVAAQVNLQKQMLNLCSRILKVGGTLLYSVCSICKNEGEYQIADFLKYNTNFKIVPITNAEISAYGTWNDDLLLPDGTIRTMPYYLNNKNGMDCFFICKMQRII